MSDPDERNPSTEREEGAPVPEQEYEGRVEDQSEDGDGPDVTLDVPILKVEETNLDATTLRVRVSLQAELANMVNINVGVDASLDDFKLEVKGMEAQALLKTHLANVRDIFGKALDTINENPDILKDLSDVIESSDPGERALEGVAGDVGKEEEDDEAPEDEAPEDGESGSPASVEATSAARQKAEELGVNLSAVEATGAGGRILIKDVMRSAAGNTGDTNPG